MWCELRRCRCKTTLADAQGFLFLKPSDLQPPSVSLPSPSCVFRPAMKHSDGVSTLCLMFPLTHTLSVNSGGCISHLTPTSSQKTRSTAVYFLSAGISIEAKSAAEQGKFCRALSNLRGERWGGGKKRTKCTHYRGQ